MHNLKYHSNIEKCTKKGGGGTKLDPLIPNPIKGKSNLSLKNSGQMKADTRKLSQV